MGTIIYILKVVVFILFYLLFAKWVGFEETAIIMLAQILYKGIEIHSDQSRIN